MATPSTDLVPQQLTNDMKAMAEDIKMLTIRCASHAAGVTSEAFAIPANLNKTIDTNKKFASVYVVQCKAAVELLRMWPSR